MLASSMERIVNHLKQSSLSTRIVIALILGILTGLFFGERAAGLQWMADAWIP